MAKAKYKLNYFSNTTNKTLKKHGYSLKFVLIPCDNATRTLFLSSCSGGQIYRLLIFMEPSGLGMCRQESPPR
jgi:hypothetical protein